MIVLIILSSSFFLSFINRYDNKYYNVQAPVKNGQLLSNQLRLEDNALYSLVDNWLFYPHIYRNASTRISPCVMLHAPLTVYPAIS